MQAKLVTRPRLSPVASTGISLTLFNRSSCQSRIELLGTAGRRPPPIGSQISFSSLCDPGHAPGEPSLVMRTSGAGHCPVLTIRFHHPTFVTRTLRKASLKSQLDRLVSPARIPPSLPGQTRFDSCDLQPFR
jgi:hypothetical protein